MSSLENICRHRAPYRSKGPKGFDIQKFDIEIVVLSKSKGGRGYEVQDIDDGGMRCPGGCFR